MLIFQFDKNNETPEQKESEPTYYTPEQIQTYSFLKSLEEHPLSEIDLKKEAKAVFETVSKSNAWPAPARPLECLANFCKSAEGKIALNDEGVEALKEYKKHMPDGVTVKHLWV